VTGTPDCEPFDILKAEPLLRRPVNIPRTARFPVIDAHNHLFGDHGPADLVRIMDQCGVRTYVNLTGNVALRYEDNQHKLARQDIGVFVDAFMKPHPGRFACFTMADFALFDDDVLLKDAGFAARCVESLRADVARGASGLKILKELGLKFRDRDGAMLRIDDERLSPIFEEAGRLGVPVLIHVSDPIAFFRPVDHRNERYRDLKEYPGWSFAGSHFTKDELIAQRNRMIAAHPRTTFILPHVANNPEVLDSVAEVLDTLLNANIDLSARIDELGRQPYSARDFIIRYQDRILFGVDMEVSPEVYRCHFRFYETRDEYFDYPDYLGRWGNVRWRIYGLHLPDEVLRKIYHENAVRLIPGLEV
jgi:hypothetical protein